MYYIVNGKKLDPNGRPVKNPEKNKPEAPFLAHGADLPPAPEEPAADDPVGDEGTVADVSTPITGEDDDEPTTPSAPAPASAPLTGRVTL